MKKILFLLAALICFGFGANAQTPAAHRAAHHRHMAHHRAMHHHHRMAHHHMAHK